MPEFIFPVPPDIDLDLAGLSAAAEPWVARLSVPDQRIQAAPDGRNIRFYQTTGLLDRPNRYDGRTARYGRRHLLQLVAIRALQTQGLSLAQIQVSLSAATDHELQQVVAGALGPESEQLIAVPPAPVAPSAFIATELAPGVVVTIDSRVHSNTTRTLNVLRRALACTTDASTDAPSGDLP